jgi:hypothetical protein
MTILVQPIFGIGVSIFFDPTAKYIIRGNQISSPFFLHFILKPNTHLHNLSLVMTLQQPTVGIIGAG